MIWWQAVGYMEQSEEAIVEFDGTLSLAGQIKVGYRCLVSETPTQ